MNYTEVKSGHIAGIAYEHETQTLGVKFKTCEEYIFSGVHPVIHTEMMEAESPGKYFHSNVRNIFQTKRINSDRG